MYIYLGKEDAYVVLLYQLDKQKWKYPKWSSTGNLLSPPWKNHAVEYYTAAKRNEESQTVLTWNSTNKQKPGIEYCTEKKRVCQK